MIVAATRWIWVHCRYASNMPISRDSLTREAHILEQLLAKGHRVVTTVRSEEKAAPIRAAYPDKSSDELNVVIVPDIAKPDAFDEVVKIPGIEVVFHTASPFYFNFST